MIATANILEESESHLAESAVRAATSASIDARVVARDEATRRARTRRKRWVAAEHCHTRSVFGTAERDHVLADVRSNYLAMVRAAVSEDVLDQVVAELITGDCF